MATSSTTKNIEIDISFREVQDLNNVLQHILSLYISGINHYKESGNNARFEFSVRHNLEEVPEHRFDKLNGKTCIIIQSKINQK